MQALFVKDGKVRLLDTFPSPGPAENEALIKISLAGICSTDLHIVKGYAGFKGVLGHEFVGIVEDVGTAGDEQWIGRRVVGEINIGCGRCAVCLSTGPEHCPERTVLGIIRKDGVFADYSVLSVDNLLEVPAEVTDEEAVFTEPLAAALRIRDQIRVSPSSRAAVVGPGRLGLLVGQVLALDGTEVTMLGRRESSLELPRKLGLKTGLASDVADNSFDLVVEATGNNAGFAEALRIVRPLGTLVLKSTFEGQSNLDLTKLVVAEITVIGSRCGPFEPALRLLRKAALADGTGLQVRPMIDATYPFSQALEAMTYAARPGVRKVLLKFD